MSDDEKIISLDARRGKKRKGSGRPHKAPDKERGVSAAGKLSGAAPEAGPPGETTPGGESPPGEATILLAPPADEGGGEGQTPPAGEGGGLAPLPGKLIWLYCPKCETLQYTEVWIPGGRVHNKCGTRVEEAELVIDVRGEFTLAEANLERLQLLGEVLEAERARFQEYRERLTQIAGEAPTPYPLDEETVKRLPIAEVGPLGLLISEALHNPVRYFKGEKPDPEAPTPAPATPPSKS